MVLDMLATVPPATKGRRFHHKSRYGCAACKKRRRKCDERKPVCGNCAQRSVECSFKSLEPASRRISTIGNASRLVTMGVPAQVPSSGAVIPFCRNNTRDLELYCHFQIYTSVSMAHSAALLRLYREDIPNLSASFPFVGHGVLSVAYFHLASLSPHETSKKLLTESAFHINQALPSYLETIKNITPENSSAVFSFAMFVVLFTFANASEETTAVLHTARAPPRTRETTIQCLSITAARVARSIQNIFLIFARTQQWISSSPVSLVAQQIVDPTLNESTMQWMHVEDEHLAKLSQLWKDDSVLHLKDSCALSRALACLRDTFRMVTQLTVLPAENIAEGQPNTSTNDLSSIHKQLCAGHLYDAPSVFLWYIQLSPDFIDLLEEGNAYAMVVLAHYAIVLNRACFEKWWIFRLAHRFVATAEVILGEEKRTWIEWPLMVVAT
ncbi:hypothetical protein BJX68DRAFT_238073 [Aspergillus pseudodeflectus]|uniref:Zn(2)-C6 fungal-type domain-containing protein n=1 Tax=Aspergillus pseudodeflectus TaxID=176178 RepID=A0ABR4K9L1_9EURO